MTRGGLPVYIALEGIDGAGKSEVTDRLCSTLEALGLRCCVHRFTHIGSGRWGRFMRRLYFPDKPGMALLLLDRLSLLKVVLFWANARLNLRQVQIDRCNDLIIGDRSIITLYAMFPRCLIFRWLSRKFISLLSFPVPEYVFLLQIEPDSSIQRLLASRGALAPNERLALLRRNKAEYSRILVPGSLTFNSASIQVYEVDAQRPLDLVLEEIRVKVTAALRRHTSS